MDNLALFATLFAVTGIAGYLSGFVFQIVEGLIFRKESRDSVTPVNWRQFPEHRAQELLEFEKENERLKIQIENCHLYQKQLEQSNKDFFSQVQSLTERNSRLRSEYANAKANLDISEREKNVVSLRNMTLEDIIKSIDSVIWEQNLGSSARAVDTLKKISSEYQSMQQHRGSAQEKLNEIVRVFHTPAAQWLGKYCKGESLDALNLVRLMIKSHAKEINLASTVPSCGFVQSIEKGVGDGFARIVLKVPENRFSNNLL